jgi:hypothetical protein
MTEDEAKNKAAAPLQDLSDIRYEEPEGGMFSTYSNIVNFDWTLYDVRLRFGELIHVPNDDNPVWANQTKIVLEKAAINIPWRQAKILRDMLDGVIRNYETINGELGPVKLPAAPPTVE